MTPPSDKTTAPDGHVMDRLFDTICARRHTDPQHSYTARLLAAGRVKIANKVGEEAAETISAALAQTPERLVCESADLLYHLNVLWAEVGITPTDVWNELTARTQPDKDRP